MRDDVIGSRTAGFLATAMTLAFLAAGCTTGSGAHGTRPAGINPPVGHGTVSSAGRPAGGTSTPSTLTTDAGTTTPSTPATLTMDPGTTTPSTPAPVTPDGMATGPGVTDTTITLGLLVDASLDRGFSTGVAVWQHTANAGGGVCGRSIQVSTAGQHGVPGDVGSAYLSIGRGVLGLITLTSRSQATELGALIGADGVPALTPVGTSEQIRARGPVVIGPTDDILAINALDYLTAQHLVAGDTVGVLSDDSPAAENGLAGLTWQAQQSGIRLQVRSTSDPAGGWEGLNAVVSLAGPEPTANLLESGPADLTVITMVDGFDSALISASDAGRLLVVSPTPAFDSDHPALTAAAAAFAREGVTDPGPRSLAGYATGAAWGRILTGACANLALTRSGVAAALAAAGPAPVDSLLGPTDPSLVVTRHLPATRLSAISVANASAPTGLHALTWLQAAGDIADYRPAG